MQFPRTRAKFIGLARVLPSLASPGRKLFHKVQFSTSTGALH